MFEQTFGACLGLDTTPDVTRRNRVLKLRKRGMKNIAFRNAQTTIHFIILQVMFCHLLFLILRFINSC
jgi:hypothetical protein